jgi:hypothetical protein
MNVEMSTNGTDSGRRIVREESGEEEIMPALFTGLEELIVVVSEAIEYDGTAEEVKEQSRDQTLSRLQKDSALPKMPDVKIMGDAELKNRTRWAKLPLVRDIDEDGYTIIHRDDCRRY